MSALPPELAKLTPKEMLDLADLLYETAHADCDLTPAQKADLDQRIADMEANPDDYQTWEEVKAELERDE